jgi:hypothetical protein
MGKTVIETDKIFIFFQNQLPVMAPGTAEITAWKKKYRRHLAGKINETGFSQLYFPQAD